MAKPRPWAAPNRAARGMSPARIFGLALAVVIAFSCLLAPAPARAQDHFVGDIVAVPYNFAPLGWALCNGQILPISQNTALFSLLGTQFGGDGKSTFALPDLRGRIAIGQGQGPGLQPYFVGEQGGEETHTLTVAEMAAHTHTAFADSAAGTSGRPGLLLPARNAAGIPIYGPGPTVGMSPAMVGISGGGQPHENRPPYLGMNYIIALQGIFPPRSKPGIHTQAGASN
jgi:microcystin-dependent protein